MINQTQAHPYATRSRTKLARRLPTAMARRLAAGLVIGSSILLTHAFAHAAGDGTALESQHMSAEPMGTFVLSGRPNPQLQPRDYAVLLRCQTDVRNNSARVPRQRSCAPVVSEPIKINDRVQVPAGDYILGFGDMVYPGLFRINAGETREIKLIPYVLPKDFGTDASMWVFRDLTRLEEQRKIYFSEYLLGQPLFPLTVPDGYKRDLYMAEGDLDRKIPASARYQLCDLKTLPPLSPAASRLCRMWRVGHPMALSEFFKFKDDSTYEQFLFSRQVDFDGTTRGIDAETRSRGRLLITPNTQLAGSYLNLLPGAYRVEIKGKAGSKVLSVVVGYKAGTFTVDDPFAVADLGFGPALNPAILGKSSDFQSAPLPVEKDEDDTAPQEQKGKTCRDVNVLYKTEFRSYCVGRGMDPANPGRFVPNVEGCDLNTAKFCELLPVVK